MKWLLVVLIVYVGGIKRICTGNRNVMAGLRIVYSRAGLFGNTVC